MAAFVLAFLCLNVGGVLCLTYCTQITMASHAAGDDTHLSEHCRKAKQAAEEKNKDSSRLQAGEASCCMLPVTMFSAPVEKRPEFSAEFAVQAPAEIRFELTAPVSSAHTSITIPVYRPPPLDRRGERILHSVIRI
jgi:hypothetical protein